MAASSPAAAGFKAAVSLALALGGCTTAGFGGAPLDRTKWQVTAIDGQPTPRNDSYRMTFDSGRLGARFGCNHVGGSYRLSGETMTTTNVASTLMGCPEPAGRFESEALAVLNQPMRLSRASDAKLTLSNAAGSIALERLR